jgi:hypothetical protein
MGDRGDGFSTLEDIMMVPSLILAAEPWRRQKGAKGGVTGEEGKVGFHCEAARFSRFYTARSKYSYIGE